MPTYKGWKAFIQIADTSEALVDLGYSESVTVDVATGLEPYYQHGSRRPVLPTATAPSGLSTGNEEITGSISRAWINNGLLELLAPGTVAASVVLQEFVLYCYIDPTGTAPWMYLYGCKLESGSFDIPQDGFIMNDVDFRALYLVYGLT